MASRKRAANSDQDDLFNEAVSLLLPPRFAIDSKVLGSPVRQLAVPALREICRLQPFSIRRVNGYESILSSGETLKIISSRTATQLDADLVLLVPEASEPSKIAATLELGEGRWMNVIPTDIDVYKPERWVDDALFRPESRAAYHQLIEQGWTDSVRKLHPKERIYTFWDYFRNSFGRDAGLRIDHLLLNPVLAPRLRKAGVDREVRGWEKTSDHAPTWIEVTNR